MQHHFTTPEQAKALLELGVPQTSADMYCFRDVAGNLYYNMVPSWQPIFSKERFWNNFPHDYIPIWSVGRLIEIIRECATNWVFRNTVIETLMTPTTDNVDVLVRLMTADECKSDLDFSKLED